LQLTARGMIDDRDTDAIEISGFDDTDRRVAVQPFEDTDAIAIEPGSDATLDLDDTDRVVITRARTQPHWPSALPPPPRRHKAVYVAVARPQTSSDDQA